MTMMVAGAVLIHFGLVGVGALWKAPEPPDVFKDIREFPPTSIENHNPSDEISLVVTSNAPKQGSDEENAVLQPLEPSDAPPVVVVPEMPDPSDATPAPRPRHVSARPVSSSTAAIPARSQADAVGSRSVGANGLPGNGGAGVVGWKTPKPPYPAAILALRVQGATTVRITTDAGGNVVTVEIVKSAGNPVLDHQTQIYVRTFWKGPPNAARTTEFVYQIL